MTKSRPSYTIRRRVACGKIKVIVEVNDKNEIDEIGVVAPVNGTCKANLGALEELINGFLGIRSKLKRYIDGDIEKVPTGFFSDLAIKICRGHTCHSCAIRQMHENRGDEKVDDSREEYKILAKSCPAAVAACIQEVALALEQEKKQKELVDGKNNPQEEHKTKES